MKKRLSDLKKNLKIYLIEENLFKRIIILDTEKLISFLENENSQIIEFTDNKKENPILGTIVIEKTPKLPIWTTISVAAEHGYGPLLYELAMSAIYPHFLSPDDASRVNEQAKKIWKKFLTRKDIDSKPKFGFEKLSKILELQNKQTKNCLFFQYCINKPLSYKRFLLGKNFIKKITKNEFEFKQTISNAASNFFIENYMLLD